MAQSKTKTTILLADDHPIFRHGLGSVIGKTDDFEIVAEAENGTEAIELATKLKPDVAILDVDMPVVDGIEAARRIRDASPTTRMVFLTMHRDRSILHAMDELGVSGYVLKDAAMNEIAECIDTVINGNKYLSPSVVTLKSDGPRSFAVRIPELDLLTKGEIRVLQMIARSRTNREIAAELFVSVRTVETHRYNICTKLGLTGPHALFKFASDNRALIYSLDNN